MPEGPELAFDVVGIVRTPGDVTSREADIDPNFLTPAFASTYGDDIAPFGEPACSWPSSREPRPIGWHTT